MESISGYCSLLQRMGDAFEDHSFLQILGCTNTLKQLSLHKILASDKPSKKPFVVLVFPTEKSCLQWLNSSETNFKLPSSEIDHCFLPCISLWGVDRYANHSTRRLDRMRALQLTQEFSKSRLLLTTLPALLQSIPPREQHLSASLDLFSKKLT